MPFTFVNAQSEFASGSSNTMTGTAFVATAGNLITVSTRIGGTGGPTVTSMTDTAGNTYTFKRRQISVTYTEVWECQNCLGHASNQITVNWSGSQGARGLQHAQYSNPDPYSLVAALGGFTQAAANPNKDLGLAAIPLTNGLVVGFFSVDGTGGTWSPQSGTTERAEDASGVQSVCDVIVTTPATADLTTRTNTNQQMNILGLAYQDDAEAVDGGSLSASIFGGSVL